MNNDLPLVWVVIPTWNRQDDLLNCVESVQALDYPNKGIVVVDNGSTDDSVKIMQENFPSVSIIELSENQGASYASNAGLSFAHAQGADYFLRIDSDTILAPDLLLELVKSAQQYPEAGILGCKIFYHDRPEILWSAGAQHHSWYFGTKELGRGQKDGPDFEQPRQLDYVWSAGILITREAYEATGGFDTDYFVYFEDPDFCVRVRKADFTIRYVPTAVMWHKVGELIPNTNRAYQWGRGKMLFFRKHSAGMHRLGLIVYAYAYAFFRAVWQKPNVGNRGPLHAALRGLTAGLVKPISHF